MAYILFALLTAAVGVSAVAFGMWRFFARTPAQVPRSGRISTPALVVFGLLTFWIYTVVRMGALLQARGARAARVAKLTMLFASGYAVAAALVGYWFTDYLILGRGESTKVAIATVAASSVVFYVTTIFFMLTTFRALEASEKLMSELALFLVVAFPISVSPAVGLHLFLQDLDSLAARIGPAICFALAAIFHVWGTILLSRAHQPDPDRQAREAGPERRELMAIMLTDMSGYSRRMEANEERAFAQVREHNALVREQIARFGGDEIKTTGDGFLVLFKSAVDAVATANAIQAALAQRSKGRSAEETLSIRIGLHIGDVRLAEGDVFGDAVNVTARIEPLSPVGGICMSEDIYGLVRKKMDLTAERVEGVQVKNIAAPLTVYRVQAPA